MRPLMILTEAYDALFITDLKFLIMGYVPVVVSRLEYPEIPAIVETRIIGIVV